MKPERLKGVIPYDSRSEDIGFVEVLRPGCFTASLRRGGWRGDVICRVEHDVRLLLGRRSAGTLRLTDRSAALHYEVDLPHTQCGRDTGELVARGDLRSTSFTFLVEEDDALVEPDGTLLRHVLRAELLECSPVSEPAYPRATVTAAAAETVAEAAARMNEDPSEAVPLDINRLRVQMQERDIKWHAARFQREASMRDLVDSCTEAEKATGGDRLTRRERTISSLLIRVATKIRREGRPARNDTERRALVELERAEMSRQR